MSLVALEHTHIKNGSAVTISGENHQDAAKPGGEERSAEKQFTCVRLLKQNALN